VDIGSNNITDKGAITLVRLLEFNNKITSKIIIEFTDYDNENISYQVEELLTETLDLLIQQEKYDVALIKIFDRIHNLQTLGARSPEKALKVVKETIGYFITLCIRLEIPTAEQQLVNLCYKNLPINSIPALDYTVF
jgi:(p)ppGpp synthase/HD superfamily hydrolase